MEKLKLGDRFESTITDLTLLGQGFIKLPTGAACYIPNVWPGDHGVFEITLVKKRFYEAKIIQIVKPSVDRVTPPCPHFGWEEGKCSSCPWSIASYDSQISFKEKMIRSVIERSGYDIKNLTMNPSPKQWGYRNRAQIKTDGIKLGFISRKTNTLVKINSCLLMNAKITQLIDYLKNKLPNTLWVPPKKFKFSFFDLDDRQSESDLKVNTRGVFRQGNSEQNHAMKAWLEQATQKWSGPTLELFAGSGNFTEVLVKNPNIQITASEMPGTSVKQLKKLFPSVHVCSSDHYDSSSWKLFNQNSAQYKYLVLDPPREGFPLMAEFLGQFSSLREIIYISCDLHHLGQDLKALKPLGFRLKEITGIDQFPQTPHVETMVHLHRN